jgi:hypothetical protein
MNKNDIIKRLQELPDNLPVIFRQQNDSVTPVGYGIREIEVCKAYKSFHGSYIKYQYGDERDPLYKDKTPVDVIWIK